MPYHDILGLPSDKSNVMTRKSYNQKMEKLLNYLKKTKLHGPNPRANYTDQATTACRRSDCQLLHDAVGAF
jgi:hypothetical protein